MAGVFDGRRPHGPLVLHRVTNAVRGLFVVETEESRATPETQGAADRACLGGQHAQLTHGFESRKAELEG